MNTPKNDNGELNYNFNPMIQMKEYLEAIHADIAERLRQCGVNLTDERTEVSLGQEGWVLEFSCSNSKSFSVRYLTDGFGDDSWKIGRPPYSDDVRFPRVKCKFWSKRESFSLYCHTNELEGKIFFKMISTFLKSKN